VVGDKLRAMREGRRRAPRAVSPGGQISVEIRAAIVDRSIIAGYTWSNNNLSLATTMTIKKALPILPKKIALVAHDGKKRDLVEWARFNRGTLAQHTLFATGTTGRIMEEELGLPVQRLQSGPLGGDEQIGAMIVEGKIDFMIFFWDPLEAQPHDPDVKALLRLTVVWNIPAACNRATADYIISSPLMHSEYQRAVPDYGAYLGRTVPAVPSREAGPAQIEAQRAAPAKEELEPAAPTNSDTQPASPAGAGAKPAEPANGNAPLA